MGWLKDATAENSLIGALVFFRKYISKLRAMSECEIYMLIVVCSVYLYAKYYKWSDRVKDGEYYVNARTICKIYSKINTDLEEFVGQLVDARNRASHEPFTSEVNKAILDIYRDDRFEKFLMFEGIIDKSGRFIEPENGCYLPVDKPDEALDKDNVDNPFGNAVAIMNSIKE